MTELTETLILTAIATDSGTATTELTNAVNNLAQGGPITLVPILPGYSGPPIEIFQNEAAISAYHTIRWLVTKGLATGSALQASMLANFSANMLAPPQPPTHTVSDLDDYFFLHANGGSTILSSGDITAAFNGVPSITIFGSGNPPATGDEFTSVSGNVIEPTTDIAGMCGLTTYNRVEGHFFLKQLPQPKIESVKRTVQGLADQFESQYEDPYAKTLVTQNERVKVTERVFVGEALNVQTSSQVSTYTTVGTSIVKHAIVAQGGNSFIDTTYGNVVSSSQDTMVAIAVEDIRPFSLKGLDTDEDALFDMIDPTKPTNENYVRHVTPEKESRIAVLETPQALRNAGGPPQILIYYNAIDPTGELVAGWKGNNSWFTPASHAQTYRNDIDGINTMSKKGWLIVEKTMPDTNTVFVDNSNGYPVYRSILDWIRRPYTADQFGSPPTWDALTLHAPGGLIAIPSKDFQSGLTNHSLRANPTGDLAISPFVNVENCAHTVIQETIAGNRIRDDGYGSPIAISNTRSITDKNDSIYHTITIQSSNKNKDTLNDNDNPFMQPVNYEQFDIIDNIVEADRHLLLIHPSNRNRTKTLNTIYTQQNGVNSYHNCTIEMTLMRGRVEEINPVSGDMSSGGVALRGRSQLIDITDKISERDFDLNEGFPIKEIGDLGSPTVSITLGGLGQGGIDVAPVRTEHSKLPVWKDKVIGTNNPSVRNDRQTSTYYASTRALVELPLFPSMFYDIEQILPDSEYRRSPLPSDKSMEIVVDCTMSAVNRPQMQNYENRWAIDWGLRGEVSSFKVHNYSMVAGRTIIRFMRENASSYLKLGTYSGGETTATGGSAYTDAYIEVDDVQPFIQESGIDVPNYNTTSTGVLINALSGHPIGQTSLTVDTVDATTQFKPGDEVYNHNTGSLLGVVSSVTSTNITLRTGIPEALVNNTPLGSPYWSFGAAGATPNGDNGFAVTIGEGVINDTGGIRVRVYKVSIEGLSHRLYFDSWHDWADKDATLSEVQDQFIIGLPVVMGCWLSDDDFHYNGTVKALTGFSATVGTSNSTMAQAFIDPMRYALCLGRSTSDNKTAICIDPTDDSRLLINKGPTMEGFSFDPSNHLFGDDDFPLQPPVECRTGHFALKGKRNDETLDHVRPLHINLGTVANSKNVSNFKEGVNEIIRLINQAGHPNAKNTNGGSAFNPPQLFTETDGTETVSSLDTGTHMGYVRAFIGQEVESRDGEVGISIVIHSTIPGATGRNFALWLHNNSPYPYRPIQAIGHGGLLATNSRSYQASSFAAPLPLGMDGETHIPITTFQGGVHGRVEDGGGNLRTYNGIGSEFIIKSVKNARQKDGDFWPVYDTNSFPHIAVERKALDVISRLSQNTSSSNLGYIVVDDALIGTFENIVANIGATQCRVNGVGACCFLGTVRPLDDDLTKKWTELFVDREGNSKEAVIKIVYPLPDAHGILFFGGGHTGTVFDISDGTDNDYSDFYTHHYSQGPTGYSGFQNLQEVQTSAAVLDFTKLKNSDTVKENTYRGLHGKYTLVSSGVADNLAHTMDNDCLFYARLNEGGLFSTNHGTDGKELVLETLFGRKLLAYGNFSASAIDGVDAPISVDPESKGIDLATADNAAISLHKQSAGMGQSPQLRVPIIDAVNDDWSVSFLFSAKPNTGSWTSEAYGNGPVIQGIDTNNGTFGVGIETKENAIDPNMMDVIILVRTAQALGSQSDYRITLLAPLPKDAWHHVVVARTGTYPTASVFVNGVQELSGLGSSVTQLGNIDSSSYRNGTAGNSPHLPTAIGVPHVTASGVLVNKSGGYTAGENVTIVVDTVDATTQFSIGDAVFDPSGNVVGVVASLTATAITLTTKNIVALNNNDDLQKGVALSSGFYGRNTNMLTIGTALHSYSVSGTYFYGRHHSGTSNNTDPIYFKGGLADIALWKKAFTADEVTELYNALTVWD